MATSNITVNIIQINADGNIMPIAQLLSIF